MNDFILKFVAVIFKILIIMLPGNLLPYRKRVREILHCSILETYDIITEKQIMHDHFLLFNFREIAFYLLK